MPTVGCLLIPTLYVLLVGELVSDETLDDGCFPNRSVSQQDHLNLLGLFHHIAGLQIHYLINIFYGFPKRTW